MGKVPRFKKVLAGFINRRPAFLGECDVAGKNVSNPRPNVVMHP
jgi:hypothetical protein